MAWATISDCTRITGVTPSDADLALAQSIIEIHVGRTEAAADSMTTRDLDNLQKAVAFQAAWASAQVDLLTRVGAKGVSQDGLSAQFRNDVDQVLAPIAQRALKNLSWMGTRSIRTRGRSPLPSEGDLAGVTASSWLHSGADPEEGWEQL